MESNLLLVGMLEMSIAFVALIIMEGKRLRAYIKERRES